MIISTTPTLEGKIIKKYMGVIFGEAISGIDFLKDFGASITNFTGGRVEEYEEEVEVNVKEGDLFQLGKHRLYCGDSTIEGNVMKLLDGADIRQRADDLSAVKSVKIGLRQRIGHLTRAVGTEVHEDHGIPGVDHALRVTHAAQTRGGA